jgi:Flp pilus assembly protein TadD
LLAPRFRLAAAYVARKDNDRAVMLARELQETAPNNPFANAALAEALLAKNDRPSAIAAFRRTAELAPQLPGPLVRLSEALILDGRLSEAFAEILHAVELRISDARAQQALIELSRRPGRLEDTIKFLRELGKREPDDPAIDSLTAEIFEADGQYDSAVRASAKAFKKRETSELARRLAQEQARASDVKSAKATLETWLKKHPDDRAARLLFGALLASDGHRRDAVKQYERLIAEKPDDPLVLNELAWLYQQVGDNGAQKTAERAYALDPNLPGVADMLGWILVENGNLERGAPLIRKAAGVPTAPPTVRYHLAAVPDKAGQRDDAKRLLEELLLSKVQFADRPAAEKLMVQLGG